MPVFKLCLHILKSRLVSYHSDLKFNANFILLNYFSHIAISSFYRLHVSKPILRNGGGGGVWKIQQSERKVVLGLLIKKRGICSLRPPSAMLRGLKFALSSFSRMTVNLMLKYLDHWKENYCRNWTGDENVYKFWILTIHASFFANFLNLYNSLNTIFK